MTEDEVRAIVRAALDARIAGIMSVVAGVELAVAHAFNVLVEKGATTTPEAAGALRASATAMIEQATIGVGVVLRRIATLLETPPPDQGPASMRAALRVVQGGLSDQPPPRNDSPQQSP